jgi:hypothetical protein
MPPNGKSEKRGASVTLAKIDGGLSRRIWTDGSCRIDTWSPKGWRPGGASADEFLMCMPATDAFMSGLGLSPSDIAAARKGEG